MPDWRSVPASTDPRSPDALGLPPELDAAGINLAGVLSSERYDALVPTGWRCRRVLPGAASVVVLACGGNSFARALRAAPEAASRDPVDDFTRRVVQAAVQALVADGSDTRALFHDERRQGVFADFPGLARACGLGEPSRLGLLLHPRFGPWLAIRALLLTESRFSPTSRLQDFDPCLGCLAPCIRACPGHAVSQLDFDAAACRHTRLSGTSCASECAARRSCVVGPEHAYDSEMEGHTMSASLRWLQSESS